ncbi:MAG: branched-chain amino acid transporter AzlD [Ruminococcaceae bacterium]|nr:branched-chain amino acid transporter AzlD [Oscillospiraceae bacterium]
MNNLPVSFWRSIIIIVLVALVTLATRAIPFVLFPEGKKIPKAVEYLSKVLPPAVICMLVVYCFKSVNVLSSPFGLPELIAGLTVVVLHIWKRNNLLSIGAGTIIYMILVQTVFV